MKLLVVFLGIVIVLVIQLGCPESEVVLHQLHDSSGISVVCILDVLNVGNGIVEGGLGNLTSLFGVIFDFVVENGVVESQSESDGVGGKHLFLGDFLGL